MSNTAQKCDICLENEFKLLWSVGGYQILRCLNCGLVFANVSENNLINTYEENYYKQIYPDYESDRNIHEINNIDLVNWINRFFSPGKMIEIGSAFGFFLEVAEQRGWDTCGYETSKFASSLAQTKYTQNVKNEDFLVAEIQNKVDVICLFDTIEHILKPSLYIEKISQTLRKGGGLVITTGDLSSWFARVMNKKWRMIVPPFHIYYYTQITLTQLLVKYGFEILTIDHKGKFQNLNSIMRYQLGINKNFIPKIPIKVNFGDIMQVIAKRV